MLDRAKKTSFTLVELLVVIAIIAILAGLLLPALQKAKMSVRTIACASNFHQIGKAVVLYSNDNCDFLPPYRNSTWGTPGYKDLLYANSSGLLKDYLNLNSSLIAASTCSSKAKLLCPAASLSASGGYNYSHGYNWYLFFADMNPWAYKSLKLTEFVRPTKTCLLADADNYIIRPSASASDSYPINYYRHSNGVNILWGDFHVSWKSEKDIPKTSCSNSFWLAKDGNDY